jgi:hypothetical protein
MTRPQFIILTSMSCLLALCIFSQLYLVRAAGTDDSRLRAAGAALQEGQLDYNRLQQVANWTAALAVQKNDDSLRDLLTRNNIQVKPNPSAANAPAAASPAAATTPAAPSTH